MKCKCEEQNEQKYLPNAATDEDFLEISPNPSDLYPHINVWVCTGFWENREKSIQSKDHYINVVDFCRVLIKNLTFHAIYV